ncbi:MAG: LacI family DNA-binding transcriptional regulator [Microbacteriaceae bacterium]
MATLSDVAALAGVSISAVSRVLSDAPATRVRPETRERIHAAARQLGYRPNFAGRALKLARSNVITLVVPDLTNAVFTELMRGVQEGARGHDYMVLLGSAEDLHPDADVMARLIGEGRVDGMLVQLGSDASRERIDAILDTQSPVIFINSIEPGHVGAVALDDDAGARVATEHLIALGHTRIGLAGGTAQTFTAQRRERGFRAAMADAGLPVPDNYVTSFGYLPANGRAALRAIMALPEPPTALVVANVNAAIGALGEARALRVRIPEQLSVVAVHDAWTAENTWPPLTTVKMPLRELGRRAVESLFARLNGGGLGDVVVVDPAPELITRESTAALPR